MGEQNDFNAGVIEEFRAHNGKVGGRFAGMDMLLLTTIGAKSGQQRVTPLVYVADGDRMVIIASKAGAPTNPDWFHNLVANPHVIVEVGADRYGAAAEVAAGTERDELYATMVAKMPFFGEYQKNTERTIPVVTLTRA